MQMFEQHSAFVVQLDDSILHCAPPHTPPLQSRLQQSSAFAQAVPFPTQNGRHWTRPVPVCGSQRPLQHWDDVVHAVPEASQLPPSMHSPSMQKWEQQSSGCAHAMPLGVQLPPVDAVPLPLAVVPNAPVEPVGIPVADDPPEDVAVAAPDPLVVPLLEHPKSVMETTLKKNVALRMIVAFRSLISGDTL